MKKIICLFILCLLLVGCNKANNLDGSYYAIGVEENVIMEIESDTVLLTRDGSSYIGKLDTEKGTVIFEDGDTVDFAIVGDKIKFGEFTMVKNSDSPKPKEENKDSDSSSSEAEKTTTDKKEISDIKDLMNHTFENKDNGITLDFYIDDDNGEYCVIANSNYGTVTGTIDESDNTIVWDTEDEDLDYHDIKIVNGKVALKDDDDETQLYELKK